MNYRISIDYLDGGVRILIRTPKMGITPDITPSMVTYIDGEIKARVMPLWNELQQETRLGFLGDLNRQIDLVISEIEREASTLIQTPAGVKDERESVQTDKGRRKK